ncbi:hypothetical protein MKC88_10245 [[Clostridium] innocuum]|nr:hypothetical protein [[Clostridium] innocuum]
MNTRFNIGDTVYPINVVDAYVGGAQVIEYITAGEKGTFYSLTVWQNVKASLCFRSFEEAKENLLKMMAEEFSEKVKTVIDSVDEPDVMIHMKTLNEVIDSLYKKYSKYGITKEFIKRQLDDGFKAGLSLELMHVTLRLMLADHYDEDELFDTHDMAVLLDVSDFEASKIIEEQKAKFEEQGIDTSDMIWKKPPRHLMS